MNYKTLIPPGAGQNKIIRMCYLWKKLPGSKIKTLNIENTTPNPYMYFIYIKIYLSIYGK